jgi:hypothetical protein
MLRNNNIGNTIFAFLHFLPAFLAPAPFAFAGNISTVAIMNDKSGTGLISSVRSVWYFAGNGCDGAGDNFWAGSDVEGDDTDTDDGGGATFHSAQSSVSVIDDVKLPVRESDVNVPVELDKGDVLALAADDRSATASEVGAGAEGADDGEVKKSNPPKLDSVDEEERLGAGADVLAEDEPKKLKSKLPPPLGAIGASCAVGNANGLASTTAGASNPLDT